jgi:hypothetical protein
MSNLLPVNSLNEYWNTCLKLPLQDMIFWGSVLAAVMWTLWNVRNNIIYRNAILLSVSSVHFSILHLFSFWTETNVTNFSCFPRAGERMMGVRESSSDQLSDEDLLE